MGGFVQPWRNKLLRGLLPVGRQVHLAHRCAHRDVAHRAVLNDAIPLHRGAMPDSRETLGGPAPHRRPRPWERQLKKASRRAHATTMHPDFREHAGRASEDSVVPRLDAMGRSNPTAAQPRRGFPAACANPVRIGPEPRARTRTAARVSARRSGRGEPCGPS